MESIHFDETHRALRAQVARFVAEEVRPHAPRWEEEGCVPRPVLRRMGELGLLGIRYPEEHGGSALGPLATVAFAEELAHCGFGGFTITVLVHTDMASPHLVHAGSPAQIAQHLPGLVSGERISAVAITEADAGSDVAGMRTRARRVEGGWRLDGIKTFITNGVHADVYFVAARSDPEAKGSRGISMFIVERGTSGFRCSRSLRKMGWHSSDTAELVFDDCFVPDANLLGEENKGFYAVMKNFQNERLVLAAMTVGECTLALRLTLDYVMARRAFGATLWEKQGVRQRLAMLEARVQAARQLVYHVGWLCERGVDCIKEVSALKALCGELTNDVMYDCLQFHGGSGFIHGTEIERMARDARVMSIGGGATEVMLEEVARRMPG